jgi:hypothetical protein
MIANVYFCFVWQMFFSGNVGEGHCCKREPTIRNKDIVTLHVKKGFGWFIWWEIALEVVPRLMTLSAPNPILVQYFCYYSYSCMWACFNSWECMYIYAMQIWRFCNFLIFNFLLFHFSGCVEYVFSVDFIV